MSRQAKPWAFLLTLTCSLISFTSVQGQSRPAAVPIQLLVTEKGNDTPLPCRVHLFRPDGKPFFPRGLPRWKDHFVFKGDTQLELTPGRFRYEIERGPEYKPARGFIEVTPEGSKPVHVTLERLVDLAKEGWWSGDLHVHRSIKDIELLMAAEDLHVAPVITWWQGDDKLTNIVQSGDPLLHFAGDRWSYVLAGEDEREGGALLFFHLDKPLTFEAATTDYPPMVASLPIARKQPKAHIDIEKPFWWDIPIWLSTVMVDTIGIANNHMNRSGMHETEAWGVPRDESKLPPPRGDGFWSQEIYYQILNAGIRLSPSAGSASGVLPNPVGYNRVYVELGPKFDYDKWWDGLRAGRSFVTNGPLLRCGANGEPPGQVFTAPARGHIDIKIDIELQSNDPVSHVEVIRNGQVVSRVDWKHAQSKGSLGTLSFDQSGWFLVRVIADVDQTFRFASTAPYFVQIGEQPFISRSSVQFFIDWLGKRRNRIKLPDGDQKKKVLETMDEAEEFWQDRLTKATAP